MKVEKDDKEPLYGALHLDKKIYNLKLWFTKTSADAQDRVRSINRARNMLTHHDASHGFLG